VLGRRWGGREAAYGGGVLIPVGFEGVEEGQEMGRRRFSGGVKAVRRHFGSARCTQRRVAIGEARRGGTSQRRWRLRRREVEDAPSQAERLHRPVGQLGQCKVFGLGEEGGSSGLRWAKKSERLGPAWEFPRKIQIGLPRPTG
jgi:hypothetical protein